MQYKNSLTITQLFFKTSNDQDIDANLKKIWQVKPETKSRKRHIIFKSCW